MGTYVENADELAEAIVKLRYVDLMGMGSDIANMVRELKIAPAEPHEWAELFYDWAEARVAVAKEDRERRLRVKAEADAKASATPQPVNLQKGVAR